MNLFARAQQNLNLSPGERASLKLVKGIVVTALLAAVTAIYPLISTGSLTAIDWKQVIAVASIAFTVQLITTLQKYLSAHLDPPLSTAVEALATDTLNTLGAMGEKQGVTLPPPDDSTPAQPVAPAA